MTVSDNNKVLIVGAGIGGLALAQGLRKHNIPFEIFERDEDVGSRKQGWAIALVEALPRFRDMLPADLGDVLQVSVNANIDEPDYLAIVDAETGSSEGFFGAEREGTPGFFLRAGRAHMRQYLWNNLPVSTGKQFSYYTEDADGVTVYFKDGSSATGSILIGADGASSHIRGQLLGGSPELNPYIPIVGECTLTREQYEPLAAVANCGMIIAGHDIRFVNCRRSISPDGETAEYFYVCCWRSDKPEEDSAWAHTASKKDLYDRCLEIAQNMPAPLGDIVSIGGPEAIVTPPIRLLEFMPPTTMPTGRVALLGDAAHVMVPFRGAGANTAVADAYDLMRLIVGRKQAGHEQSWEDLVTEYHAVMVERGRSMVLKSRAAGEQRGKLDALEGRGTTYSHNKPTAPNTESVATSRRIVTARA